MFLVLNNPNNYRFPDFLQYFNFITVFSKKKNQEKTSFTAPEELIIFIIFIKGTSQCPVIESKEPKSMELTAPCGVVLSPNFPGQTPEGAWTWVITGPQETYISFYLGTVTAPGRGSCFINYLESR